MKFADDSSPMARCWCLKLERGQGGQALRTAALVQMDESLKGGVLVAKPFLAG